MYLGEYLELSNIEAGVQTIGLLRNNTSAETVAQRAALENIDVVPLSRYCFSTSIAEGLQLGFAAVDEKEIRTGVLKLARIFQVLNSMSANRGGNSVMLRARVPVRRGVAWHIRPSRGGTISATMRRSGAVRRGARGGRRTRACSRERRSSVREELTAEDPAQYLDGEEERAPGSDPACLVGNKAASCGDAVDMRMVLEPLVPRIEHAEKADRGAEMAGIGSKVAALLGRAGYRARACSGTRVARAPAAA
jgi:hypothetical protein